jgi:hypothetical protein
VGSGYRHNSLTGTIRLPRKPLPTLSTQISHPPDEVLLLSRRRVRNRHSPRELTEEQPVNSALRTVIYAYPTPEAETRRPRRGRTGGQSTDQDFHYGGRIRESRRSSPRSRYARPVEITLAECGCRPGPNGPVSISTLLLHKLAGATRSWRDLSPT